MISEGSEDINIRPQIGSVSFREFETKLEQFQNISVRFCKIKDGYLFYGFNDEEMKSTYYRNQKTNFCKTIDDLKNVILNMVDEIYKDDIIKGGESI